MNITRKIGFMEDILKTNRGVTLESWGMKDCREFNGWCSLQRIYCGGRWGCLQEDSRSLMVFILRNVMNTCSRISINNPALYPVPDGFFASCSGKK